MILKIWQFLDMHVCVVCVWSFLPVSQTKIRQKFAKNSPKIQPFHHKHFIHWPQKNLFSPSVETFSICESHVSFVFSWEPSNKKKKSGEIHEWLIHFYSGEISLSQLRSKGFALKNWVSHEISIGMTFCFKNMYHKEKIFMINADPDQKNRSLVYVVKILTCFCDF